MKKIKPTEESKRGLFVHFRDLGLVCDEIKPVFSFRGGVGFVTCSVNHTFHIYSVHVILLHISLTLFSSKNLN